MKYKKYEKVVTSGYAMCAIYEPNPFRPSAIIEALGVENDTSPKDSEWCWVCYDWCGNPIGLSEDRPEGEVVEKFTRENLPYCSQPMIDYFNLEYYSD